MGRIALELHEDITSGEPDFVKVPSPRYWLECEVQRALHELFRMLLTLVLEVLKISPIFLYGTRREARNLISSTCSRVSLVADPRRILVAQVTGSRCLGLAQQGTRQR